MPRDHRGPHPRRGAQGHPARARPARVPAPRLLPVLEERWALVFETFIAGDDLPNFGSDLRTLQHCELPEEYLVRVREVAARYPDPRWLKPDASPEEEDAWFAAWERDHDAYVRRREKEKREERW